MLLSFVLSFLLASFPLHDQTQALEHVSLKSHKDAEIPFSLGMKTTAKSALVVDVSPGRDPEILLAKNANDQIPIASLSKLMSLLLFLEDGGTLKGEVAMARRDESPDEPEAQRIDVVAGEKVKKKDLFYASLLFSANNAVKALVRSLPLSSDQFVLSMNRKAQELGMGSTGFFDSTGLSLENVSTASDLFLLAKAVFAKQEIQEGARMSRYHFQTSRLALSADHSFLPTDKLLQSFLNKKDGSFSVVASKTGYLKEAGYHLVTQVKKGDHEIIMILLGSETSESRFQEAKGLVWWAFRELESRS